MNDERGANADQQVRVSQPPAEPGHGDDEVLELGEEHLVPADGSQGVRAVAPTSVRTQPIVHVQAGGEAPESPEAEEEPFELSDVHVVAEGTPVPTGDEPVDHAFDFGAPSMVFDEDVPSEQEAREPLQGAYDVEYSVGEGEAETPVFRESHVPGVPVETPGDQEVVSFLDDEATLQAAGSVAAGSDVAAPDRDVGDVFDEAADDMALVGTDADTGPSSFLPGPDLAPGGEDADDSEEIDVGEIEEVAEVPPPPETPRETQPPAEEEQGKPRPIDSFFKNDRFHAAQAALKLRARTQRSRGKRAWWESIFDDEYLMLQPERTKLEQQKQIDFIQKTMGLPPGSLVLDLACGNGRNAIGMAERNYRVVGVDLSLSMLARAGEAAQEAGQKINFIHGDMRDLGFDKTFDGVFCMDTSFGYFDEETNMKVLRGVHRALKPRGVFLLDLANRDFVIRQQPNMVWFQMDNMVCMEETDFNYINNRLYISRQIIVGDNERQTRHDFSIRLYSLHDIGQMLHQAGFAVLKVSGHRSTPGAFFGPESAKLIIVAERRG